MLVEFENFFASIFVACLERNGFWEAMHALSIDPKQWPDCKAKRLMCQFVALAKGRGVGTARALLAANSFDVETLDMPAEKFDERWVAANYHAFVDFGLCFEFSREISRRPKEARTLAKAFLERKVSTVNVVDLREATDALIEQMTQSRESQADEISIPDFPRLSTMIGGFNPGRIVIITAKTGVGKTNLSLNLAEASSRVRPTLFINMEMDRYDLNLRLLQSITGTSRRRVFTADNSTFKCLTSLYTTKIINREPLLMTSGRALSLSEIGFLIRTEVNEKGVKQVFIDYDQKIISEDPREEWKSLQVAVEAMEELSKECGVNIVLLSQADENGDPKASKRIKQSASSVLHFFDEDQRFVLEAVKNRFGRHKDRTYIDYHPETSTCSESQDQSARKGKAINDTAKIALL